MCAAARSCAALPRPPGQRAPPAGRRRHRSQRHPDQHEPGRARRTEILVEQQHARQQLQARADVLQHADGRVRQQPRGVSEQEQRHRGDDAAADQQRRDRAARAGQRAAAVQPAPQQVARRERHEQQRLGGEPRQRLDADDLAHEAVEGKAQRERTGDPRRTSGEHGEIEDAERREPDREPLHAVQPLAQHQHPEHDVHERVDVIAETGVDDVPVGHAPHVHQPVAADEQRAQHQPRQQRGAREDAGEAAELAAQQHPREDEQARPGDAVRDDLQRRHLAQRMQVDREHSPDGEGRRAGSQSARRQARPSCAGYGASLAATNTAASASRPAASAPSKRPRRGLSMSSTPSSVPPRSSGTTISEREAASQAMCPGNSCTSATTSVRRSAAAVPHTPRPSAMRTHAGLPWNGPTTSSPYLRK